MIRIKQEAKSDIIQAEADWETTARWKRDESLRPTRFALQCSECRAVAFPQEILLEGIHQIIDYFLYSSHTEHVQLQDYLIIKKEKRKKY